MLTSFPHGMIYIATVSRIYLFYCVSSLNFKVLLISNGLIFPKCRMHYQLMKQAMKWNLAEKNTIVQVGYFCGVFEIRNFNEIE